MEVNINRDIRLYAYTHKTQWNIHNIHTCIHIERGGHTIKLGFSKKIMHLNIHPWNYMYAKVFTITHTARFNCYKEACLNNNSFSPMYKTLWCTLMYTVQFAYLNIFTITVVGWVNSLLKMNTIDEVLNVHVCAQIFLTLGAYSMQGLIPGYITIQVC